MDPKNPVKLILVPRPITLPAAFAYYAIREAVPEDFPMADDAICRWLNCDPRGEFISGSGIVLNLNAPASLINDILLPKLKSKKTSSGEVRIFKAMRDFAMRGEHNETWPKWKNFLFSLSAQEDVAKALRIISDVFAEMLTSRIDPRKEVPIFPLVFPQTVPHIPRIEDRRYVTLPVVKKNVAEMPSSYREAYDFTVQPLHEKNIFELTGGRNVIAIGGPPGSGKSSLSVSLFMEMINILNSLSSRSRTWSALKLEVDIASLDAATPVVDAILRRSGRDREAVQKAKRPWSMDLAHDAVREVLQRSAKANLVFVDLPGKIDAITETLVAPVTFGGIITNDWARINEWRDFFKRTGIPIAFEVKATDETSLVTSYWRGDCISGRVNKLSRIACGWDSFVQTLAEFLLFDILPGHLQASRKRLDEFAKR